MKKQNQKYFQIKLKQIMKIMNQIQVISNQKYLKMKNKIKKKFQMKKYIEN